MLFLSIGIVCVAFFIHLILPERVPKIGILAFCEPNSAKEQRHPRWPGKFTQI